MGQKLKGSISLKFMRLQKVIKEFKRVGGEIKIIDFKQFIKNIRTSMLRIIQRVIKKMKLKQKKIKRYQKDKDEKKLLILISPKK